MVIELLYQQKQTLCVFQYSLDFLCGLNSRVRRSLCQLVFATVDPLTGG